MEEIKRVARHFAPVVTAVLVAKYALPDGVATTLTPFLGEALEVFAAAIGGAVGYMLSWLRDKKRAKA